MSVRYALLLSLLFVGCSTPASTIGTDTIPTQDTLDLVGEDAVPGDAAGADITPDLAPDVPGIDLVGYDESSPCEPGEGCFGDPCDTGADCLSGYCVLHMGEQVCTDICVEECPGGFECRQVAQAEPDVVFICASLYPALCLPCTADAECSDLAGPGSSCIDYGAGGHFCGAVCTDEADCPGGTTCEQVPTVEGLLTAQCVHESGACPCTAYAVEIGAAALCSQSNEHGLCAGLRTCTEEGLSPCDAATPGEEVCNGLDDDCDGETDDVDCDDGNDCTDDLCEGEGGCTHTAGTGGECLDGDACTIGDHCDAGVCVGSPLNCDDGNGCTNDSCDPDLGCQYEYTTDPCDDGDPCSVGDSCLAGSCVGLPGACECQEDADCLALVDGDLCVGQWYCSKAQSPFQCLEIPGSAVTCPEAAGVDQHCYQWVCQPDTGECLETPVNGGGPCEDGDACTAGDLCNEGACVSGPSANCNDGNPCTDDSCEALGGCKNVFNAAPCSDGDACTAGDLCNQGACIPGQAVTCDDANQCTDDSCDGVAGCQFVPNAGICDDGNACTSGDHCVAGGCVPQAVVDCDDDDPCTDDSCDLAGGCVHALNAAVCDDGDLCTTGDHCHLGSCISGAGLVCDDGNLCTEDSCNSLAGCQFVPNDAACDDGNACTQGDHCAGGACVSTGILVCDDQNPCTDDACDPLSGCTNVSNAAPCSDGDPCTAGDHCEGGQCVTGAGEEDCDDLNPCTDDWCLEGDGCHHAYNSVACDDGDECSTGDVCILGICAGLGVANCDDANPCTDDGCIPELGCVNSPNSLACDDEDACTPLSSCQGGTCVGQGAIFCDPADHCGDGSCVAACFTAACEPASGCVFTPVDGCCGNNIVEAPETCDDGNLVDGDGCSGLCESEGPPGTYFVLEGTPDPAHVLDSVAVTFRYENNLTNGIWHRPSNTITVGDYDYPGYWHHAGDAGGYPTNPSYGSGYYVRMVQMPGRSMVAYTTTTGGGGSPVAHPGDLRLAAIDHGTGIPGTPLTVQLSDGYNGTCNLISSSVTELMISDGASTIRRYEVTAGSGALELVETVSLSTPIPGTGACSNGCYSGTFGWDGEYFYFATKAQTSGGLGYVVYAADGAFVGSYTAAGSGNINGVYFDWSVGRYTIHDGYGYRSTGVVYSAVGGTGDSQCYSPVSSAHTLHED